MVLSFESRQLRETCSLEEQLTVEFGAELARLIKARLADLRAAESLAEVITGNLREIPGEKQVYSLEVPPNYRLRFQAIHSRASSLGPNSRAEIRRVKILAIEENHANAL